MQQFLPWLGSTGFALASVSPLSRKLVLLLALLPVMLAGACGGSGGSSARVTYVELASQLDTEGRPLAPSRVFTTNDPRIYVVIGLKDVKPGMEFTGKWFQTSTEGVPPEGAKVHESRVRLEAKSITAEGETRIAFFLPRPPTGIPADSWLVRVYEGDTLLRTVAFVVTDGSAAAPQSPPSPSPVASPPAPAPATTGTAGVSPTAATAASPVATPPAPATATPAAGFTEYTVVSGDTLLAIAERFRPASEDVLTFANRIRSANNLTSDSLSIGQVLRIPR